MNKENKGNYLIITMLNEALPPCCTFEKNYIATEEMLKQLLEKVKSEREERIKEIEQLRARSEKVVSGKQVKSAMQALYELECLSLKPDLMEETIEKYLAGEKDIKFMYWPFAKKVSDEFQTLVCKMKDYEFDCDTGISGGIEEVTLRYIFVPSEEYYTRFVFIDEIRNAYQLKEGEKEYITFDTPKNPNIFICDAEDNQVARPLLGFFGDTVKKEDFEEVKYKFVSSGNLLFSLFEDLGILTY